MLLVMATCYFPLQIEAHLAPRTVKHYVYHGPNRVQDTEFLESQDIVIITYSTLVSDYDQHSKAAGKQAAVQKIH